MGRVVDSQNTTNHQGNTRLSSSRFSLDRLFFIITAVVCVCVFIFYWVNRAIEHIIANPGAFWAANWMWICMLGLTAALLIGAKPLWYAIRAVDNHIDEKKTHKVQRSLIEKTLEAVEAGAQNGFNIEVVSSFGELIRVINPESLKPASRVANNYYSVENDEEGEPLQIGGPKALQAKDIPIPTFAESLKAGEIGPGQREVLICHELVRDEETGELTGELAAYKDALENNCTMFLGGASKSGKSTLMSHLSAQEAMMDALFYIIDPHLTHPEKSVAVKLEALKHAFILPPARTDAEIERVLQHARTEADNRVNGIETRYSGRPIVFIFDEVLAALERAQRTTNKELILMYRDLALFMRGLGTQYNKFGMNGIFASQYVTKDAFKLPPPAGNVDFRDGCQSQTLLRLPANQAQAMRLLDRDELRGVRMLPPGHGYMGFFTGEVIRMASGNVSAKDIEMAGKIVHASPDMRRQFAFDRMPDLPKRKPSFYSDQTAPLTSQNLTADDDETNSAEFSEQSRRAVTGALVNAVQPLKNNAEAASEVEASQASQEASDGKYRFTDAEKARVIDLYIAYHNIDKVLSHMKRGARWYKHASEIVKEAGL